MNPHADDVVSLALVRFERFYEALDAAIDNDDVDTIVALVDERAAAVAHLVAAYGDRPLPPDTKGRLKQAEARLRLRLTALYDSLYQRLGEQQRRNHAVKRYARAT